MNTAVLVVIPATFTDKYSPLFHRQLMERVQPDGVRIGMDARGGLELAEVKLQTAGNSTVVPIFDLDHKNPDLDEFARFLRNFVVMARRHPVRIPFGEILNEPYTMGRMPPEEYARIVAVAVDAMEMVNNGIELAIAGDFVRPNGWLDGPWTSWWRDTQGILKRAGVRVSRVAVHPYRDFSARKTRIHWPGRAHRFRFFRWGLEELDRAFEFDVLSNWTGGLPWVNTEFGWDGTGKTEAEQAFEVGREIELHQRAGIEVCCIYAHTDVLDPVTRRPTLVGEAIRDRRREPF